VVAQGVEHRPARRGGLVAAYIQGHGKASWVRLHLRDEREAGSHQREHAAVWVRRDYPTKRSVWSLQLPADVAARCPLDRNDVGRDREHRLVLPVAKRPSPTGWVNSSRRLPDGRVIRRDCRSSYVSQYKAKPTATSVKAGELIRIYSSESVAAKATGCSQGGIHHCCEFWYLEDGAGTTSLDIKGWGNVTCPDELPARSRVACSPSRQYVFKWTGLRDGRLHPVCVVLDYEQHFFYPSIKKASHDLYMVYDTPDELASRLSATAAASPMYDDPSSKAHDPDINPWPTALTRLGRVNVFYI